MFCLRGMWKRFEIISFIKFHISALTGKAQHVATQNIKHRQFVTSNNVIEILFRKNI